MKSPRNERNMAEQQNIPQKETEEEQPEQLKENQEKEMSSKPRERKL